MGTGTGEGNLPLLFMVMRIDFFAIKRIDTPLYSSRPFPMKVGILLSQLKCNAVFSFSPGGSVRAVITGDRPGEHSFKPDLDRSLNENIYDFLHSQGNGEGLEFIIQARHFLTSPKNAEGKFHWSTRDSVGHESIEVSYVGIPKNAGFSDVVSAFFPGLAKRRQPQAAACS